VTLRGQGKPMEPKQGAEWQSTEEQAIEEAHKKLRAFREATLEDMLKNLGLESARDLLKAISERIAEK
jgi:hypothetical protein